MIPLPLWLFVKQHSPGFFSGCNRFIQRNFQSINNLGDAQYGSFTTIKMTEIQWEFFRQSPLMTDVSIAKRNIEYSLSTYVIEDFKRDIDEVNRTFKLSVTVKAEALYDGDGNWEVKTN